MAKSKKKRSSRRLAAQLNDNATSYSGIFPYPTAASQENYQDSDDETTLGDNTKHKAADATKKRKIPASTKKIDDNDLESDLSEANSSSAEEEESDVEDEEGDVPKSKKPQVQDDDSDSLDEDSDEELEVLPQKVKTSSKKSIKSTATVRNPKKKKAKMSKKKKKVIRDRQAKALHEKKSGKKGNNVDDRSTVSASDSSSIATKGDKAKNARKLASVANASKSEFENEEEVKGMSSKLLRKEMAKHQVAKEKNAALLARINELERQKSDKGAQYSGKFDAMPEVALADIQPKKREDLPNSACSDIDEKTKKLFRRWKFISTNTQPKYVEELIDMLEIPELVHIEGESDRQYEKIETNRRVFGKVYEKVILTALNDNRTYVQAQMKDHTLKWLLIRQDEEADRASSAKTKPRTMTLPTAEEMEKAASRDWTDLEYKVVDLEEGVEDNEENRKELQETNEEGLERAGHQITRMEKVFDLWVDVCLTAVAGCHGTSGFGHSIRCFEPVSTCLVANSDKALRITAGSEAFALLMYRNCVSKWNATHKFKMNKTKGPQPRYSKKNKEENLEWKPRYTDSACGQNKYGGWVKQAKDDYMQLQKQFSTMRKEKADLCLLVETACCKRLQVLHRDKLRPPEVEDPNKVPKPSAEEDNFEFMEEE